MTNILEQVRRMTNDMRAAGRPVPTTLRVSGTGLRKIMAELKPKRGGPKFYEAVYDVYGVRVHASSEVMPNRAVLLDSHGNVLNVLEI